MTWVRMVRQGVRDAFGASGSFAFTTAVFVAAPICGLIWSQNPAEDLVVIDHVPLRAPVQLALGFEDDAGLSGEGGEPAEEPVPESPAPPSDPSVADADGDGGSGHEPEAAETDPVAEVGVDRPSVKRTAGAAGVRSRTTLVLRPGVDAEGAGSALAQAAQARDRVLANKNRRSKKCDPSHPDVSPLSGAHWSVNRSTVEYYTSSIKRFNSLGWSGPYDGDAHQGWKIGGFSCNSPLYHAGLRRGDVILTVNDKPTRTWLQVFGLYRKLRRHDEFRVVLLRKGQTKVLQYTLV